MAGAVLADLFDPAPEFWGLRGDPVLWSDMGAAFADTPLPTSAEGLIATIAAAFRSLTGSPLDTPDATVHVPDLAARGPGMSAGHVSPAFWRDTAVPMLVARLAEARSHARRVP